MKTLKPRKDKNGILTGTQRDPGHKHSALGSPNPFVQTPKHRGRATQATGPCETGTLTNPKKTHTGRQTRPGHSGTKAATSHQRLEHRLRGWLDPRAPRPRPEHRTCRDGGQHCAPRSPRPAYTGLPGVMTVSPLPPLGLGVAGRTLGCGRQRCARAHAQTHGGPHSDGPAAPAPGRGAESRAGEGSRQADGKQPKVARPEAETKARAPPSAPRPVASTSATKSAGYHFRRTVLRLRALTSLPHLQSAVEMQ